MPPYAGASLDAASRLRPIISDNTAADKLLSLAGGGEAVTNFLKTHGIEGMRIDIGEGEVAHVFSGLGARNEAPAGETAAAKQERLERGYHAFLADPRNSSTPPAASPSLASYGRENF